MMGRQDRDQGQPTNLANQRVFRQHRSKRECRAQRRMRPVYVSKRTSSMLAPWLFGALAARDHALVKIGVASLLR